MRNRAVDSATLINFFGSVVCVCFLPPQRADDLRGLYSIS